jgi:geranylgeranyl diphosphate synthase, type II
MVETAIELKLSVPAQRSRRIALIDAARKTVIDANVLPPVSLQTLEELATKSLEATNGNSDELAFTMLMCSNELWRPYFEATPFNRRLLLLPQCLKNSNSCAAMVDDLGLICAGCNQCPIHSTLEKAENLGYSTLVAEGSSTAIALVEEGSVDAFLGVSCLEVLQKSFKQVVSSAIPSLAIPLLHDGCKDTKVDQHWLLDEIKAIANAPDRKTLSVSEMKNRVEALFTEEFLSTQFDMAVNQSITGKLAVETMLQGGKRMRPLLTLMAYTAYSNDFNQPIADQLMLAVECFHKASLIHDDIEDGDDYRYNQKTAHHKYGIPLAINLGDYLIGQGYRKLSQMTLPSEIKLQLLDLFSSMHIESTIGQGEELAEAEIESVHDLTKTMTIFRQKTGSAIRVSLLAGAMAAEAPTSDCNILSEFSDLFGIAYQIRDDLTEFRGEATDQQCASFPFLKSMLVEKHKLMAGNQQEWKKLIEKHQIDLIADEKLDETRDRMTAVLKLISSQKLRFALLNVVNRFFEKR